MSTAVSMLIGLAGAQLVSLAKLALRLQWQLARDRLRHETLTGLMARLPAEGAIELDDVGTTDRVRVFVTAGHRGEREDDARTRSR